MTSPRDTAPAAGVCPRCLARVLRCWADGLHTTTDLDALGLPGQIHTLQTGRALYELHTGTGHHRNSYLVHRDATRIATGKPHIALATHVCGEQLKGHRDADAQRQLDEWLQPRRHTTRTTTAPPF